MIAPVRSFGWIDWLLIAVLSIVSACLVWSEIDETRFHRDEARWIGNSAILREWRHPLSIAWQDEGYANQHDTIDETVAAESQPPLAMYVIGLGLLAQGEDLPKLEYWIMSQDTEWNTANGALPSNAALRAARNLNGAITVLTVVLLYLIGRRLTNRLGALVGALIFAIHPLVIDTGTRAWSDPLLALTLALAALLAIRLANNQSWLNAVLLGIALGLGASTKLSPLLLAVAIGGASGIGLAIPGDRIGPGVRNLGLRLSISPIVAGITFVALYPYLWVSPIRNTWRMFEFRSLSFDLQSVGFPPAAVTSRADAFSRVGNELAERFSAAGQVANWLGHSPDAWLREIDLILASVGLLLLVALVFRQGIVSPAAMVLLVLGGQSLLILLTIGVEYARYFLPIALFTTTLAGVTIGQVAIQISTLPARLANQEEAATVSA